MKRINLLYIAVIFVLLILFGISRRYGKKTLMFYGFAENKETEIRLEQDVSIKKIFVMPGQQVKQGTLLAEAVQTNLPLKQNNLALDIEQLQEKIKIEALTLRNDKKRLEAEKTAKIIAVNSRIAQLEAEVERNKSLVKDLKSIEVESEDKSTFGDANLLEIEALKKELETSLALIDTRIAGIEEELRAQDKPAKVQIRKLKEEQAYYEGKEEKLSIYAPSNGVIGNIYCKETEQISSFTTLISFYAENPTRVKGYVHESLILEVDIGDTLFVNSYQHYEHNCQGIVTGLGSRIIEIPERLRKIPEFKTYGREVLISIPSNNKFLQKEKVILNLVSPN